jgi:transposase
MMGRLKSDQGQLFYEFHLGDAVPEDHLVRKIDAALDLSWLRSELAPHYSPMGRPSIDPELMIRMLVVGYVFAIRSERLICRDVQVNLAYRWFCKLGIEDAIPDHSTFSRARNERFREGDVFRHVFERVVEACIAADQAVLDEEQRRAGRDFDENMAAAAASRSQEPIIVQVRKPLRQILPRLAPSTASPLGLEAAFLPRLADNAHPADFPKAVAPRLLRASL